ncbi:F-box only protein 50 [Sceloporus undulatus]|uniref:F-box only protein 50 n=1 Tax=Sceloporus undulatus TaxID=8520 RepID=UPI001C4B7581|nr:F-box only protein 50 [Sceloporus undulatus]
MPSFTCKEALLKQKSPWFNEHLPRSLAAMAVPRQQQQQTQPPKVPFSSSGINWQKLFEAEWRLGQRGVPLPKKPDWETLYALKPFERNFLQNPNPEGVNVSEPAPPCQKQPSCKTPDSTDIFKGWQVSTEPLPSDQEENHFRFGSSRYSWCIKQQLIDLLDEGLWEELLDLYQPNITVMDWYENSKLARSVYELHVRLLGSDGTTAVREFHHVAREKEQDGEKKDWHHVSHIFEDYGTGVRYVHFLHKTKDVETAAGLLRTRATDSSVSAQLRD